MIDDHVGHHLGARRERRHVVPRSQPRIDLRVIDRVEPGVSAVDRMEERQQVDATEQSLQRPLEQMLELAERPAGQAIDVGDELRLVLHARQSGLQLRWRDFSMRPRMPLTIDDSAHPGCSREDNTSNVCLPNDASSGM